MLRVRSTEDLDGEPSAKRLCVHPEALFESQNFVVSQPDLVEYIFSQELLPHPIYEIDDFDFSFYGSCRGVSKLWNTVAEKCAIIFANAMGPKGFLLLKDFTHAAKTKKESKQRLKDLLNRKGTMIDVYYHNGKKGYA